MDSVYHGFNFPLPIFLFLLLLLLFYTECTEAAVIGARAEASQTQQDVPRNTSLADPWVNEPKSRGTMRILTSCTLTIGLSVWSTMLINIQMSASGTMKSVLKRELGNGEEEEEKVKLTTKVKNVFIKVWRFLCCGGSPEQTEPLQPTPVANKEGFWKKVMRFLKIQTNFHLFVGWKYKVLWAALALLVPELPLAIALGETWFAIDLLKEVKKADPKSFKRWDKSVANYVVMGGFYLINPNKGEDRKYTPEHWPPGYHSLEDRLGYVLGRRVKDIEDTKKLKKPKKDRHGPSKKRDVLTPHGLLFIARFMGALRKRIDADPEKLNETTEKDIKLLAQLQYHVNDIPPSALADFSKVDFVARLIVCFQAFWMFVQVIGRLVQPLPVALLELHTGLHAVCAMVMYIVWWNKPKDVTITTPIYLPKAQYDFMKKCPTEDVTNHLRIEEYAREILLSSQEKVNDEKKKQKEAVERAEQLIAPNLHDDIYNQRRSRVSLVPGFAGTSVQANKNESETITTTTIANGSGNSEKRRHRTFAQYWADLLDLTCNEEYNTFYLTSQGTLSKETYKQITGRHPFRNDPFRAILQVLTHLVFSWNRWPLKALIWFTTSFIYGGAHLASWTWHFPTRQEEILWHICTVYTVGSIANLFFLALLVSIYVPFFNYYYSAEVNEKGEVIKRGVKSGAFVNFLGKWFGWLIEFIIPGLRQVVRHGLRATALSIAIGIWPWLLARLYMLIEAYVSLRSLEVDAYKTLNWAESIPHIS
ncbi:hypothetical protein DFH27DRAFT_652746 [Peziza echinospora]|nr:hypothetical protein DFH27DRAFT_652746 [Peziza echinospora]